MTYLVTVIPLEEYEPGRTINGTVNFLHNMIQKRYQDVKELKISSGIKKKKQLSSLKNKINSKIKDYSKQSKQMWELNETYHGICGKNLFTMLEEKKKEEEEEYVSEENKVKINSLQNKIKQKTEQIQDLEDKINSQNSEKCDKVQLKLRDCVKQNNRIRFFLNEKKKELDGLEEKIEEITPSKENKSQDLIRIANKVKNERIGMINSQINKTKFQLQRTKKLAERNSHTSLAERFLNMKRQLRQRDQEYNLLEKELKNTQQSLNNRDKKLEQGIMTTSDPDSLTSETYERRKYVKVKSRLYSEDERWKSENLQEESSGKEESIYKFKSDLKINDNSKKGKKMSNLNIDHIESIPNVEKDLKESEQMIGEIKDQENVTKTTTDKEKQNTKISIDTIQVLFTIPLAVEYFKEYLVQDMCQENILFYFEAKEFTNTFQNNKKSIAFAKTIFNKYVKPGSLFEINVDYKCREQITKLVQEKNFHSEMFTIAQEVVFSHMNHNSFDPFQKSDLYKDLLVKLNNQSKFHFDLYSKKCTFVSRKMNFQVLNNDFGFQGRSRNGCQVSEELMESINSILSAHYSLSLNQIDMNFISQSLAFSRFVGATTELQRINLKILSEDERKAFFINIYNVLLFHMVIQNGKIQNPNMKKKYMQDYKYNIGGENYSLNDIRNGILRKNIGERNLPYFNKGDPRGHLVLKKADPRIHFVLNSFNAKNIIIQTIYFQQVEGMLKHITKTYLSKEILIDKKGILLPKIFQEFSIDFGDSMPQIIDWIAQFLSPRKQKKIRQLDDYTKVKFWKKIHYNSVFLLHSKSQLVKKFSDL
ncbi:electron carrier/ protein disulfide oxidoreductase [Anaeramoeba flamelloides]|uniref:Electron carrier/ protein disulfide oxidoreductase n=1 Tax=Anaeramoeba flamelloides TaxID=1746091 RepID=A0AAV8A5S2_9EUKA|nr:electron carrier/ protein disulfide oxidoreductase [Anaeramoeba flamelloides]